MKPVRMFAVAGSVVALLALASVQATGCDEFELSTTARLYQASVDPHPLLAGF